MQGENKKTNEQKLHASTLFIDAILSQQYMMHLEWMNFINQLKTC